MECCLVVEVTIRPASEQDDAALRAIDQATWSWDVSPAPRPPPDRSFFRPGVRPQDVLVAVIENAVAGYVRLVPATGLDSSRHVLSITGLAVDPARHREGIGRLLLAAAAQEASVRGARRLTLRVLAPNVAARALYESCGFEVEGCLRKEFLLDGRYVDDVLMALDLETD
jgi:ribosomal protein S18 acetylase RimI-like enzyme